MYQWGVVNRLLPAAALLEQARAFAARLAAEPTAATAVGKRLLQTARDHGVAAANAVTPRRPAKSSPPAIWPPASPPCSSTARARPPSRAADSP